MDNYSAIRQLPFPAIAAVLGIDMKRFQIKGKDWAGPCPVHGSKQNVGCFRYEIDGGRFHCFSCDVRGRGPIDLTIKLRNCGFKDAAAFLQAAFPSGTAPEPPKEKSPIVDDSVSAREAELRPLAKDTWRKFAVTCPWLEERIPDAGVREKYGVYCYDNPKRKSAWSGRVMLPVKDTSGVLYGYCGRLIPNTSSCTNDAIQNPPKYLFPTNLPKSRYLFGADVLLAGTFGPAPLRVCYLVESPFCVMKFAMWGIPAVSPFGWSVSEEQHTLVGTLAKGIVYLPDRNKYETCAETLRALGRRQWVKCPELPDGIDDPEKLDRETLLSL